MFTSSCLFAASVVAFVWYGCAVVSRPTTHALQAWDYESARCDQLRNQCMAYRWFAPLALELGGLWFVRWCGQSERVALSLRQRGSALPFDAHEFLGIKTVEAILLGVTVGVMWPMLFGGLHGALAVGIALVPIYLYTSVAVLRGAARHRMAQLKSRLPFAIDSLALMMRSGASMREAFATVVDNCRGHVLSEEFAEVLAALHRGATFRRRLRRWNIACDCRKFGRSPPRPSQPTTWAAPLSHVFLQMADHMRMHRAQEIETAAGQAQVRMLYPATLIMVAATLAIIAPFVLPMLKNLAAWT